MNEFVQFSSLVSILTADHRHGQVSGFFWASLGCEAGGPLEKPGRIEQVMEPSRHFTEEGRFLVEINIDATIKNRRSLALIWLVQGEREVQRDHQRVMA